MRRLPHSQNIVARGLRSQFRKAQAGAILGLIAGIRHLCGWVGESRFPHRLTAVTPPCKDSGKLGGISLAAATFAIAKTTLLGSENRQHLQASVESKRASGFGFGGAQSTTSANE